MSRILLDASALLALLQAEPGADVVAESLPEACISPVNLAEVVGKLADAGMPNRAIAKMIDLLALEVLDFDVYVGYETGLLARTTQPHGLSLGDRACLATAAMFGLPVLTADRTWTQVDTRANVRLIRAE